MKVVFDEPIGDCADDFCGDTPHRRCDSREAKIGEQRIPRRDNDTLEEFQTRVVQMVRANGPSGEVVFFPVPGDDWILEGDVA